MKKLRILHILTSLDMGGIETLLMNYYRTLDRDFIQFDFLLHRDGEFSYTKEIIKMGGKIFHVSNYDPLSIKYHKDLNEFFMRHSQEYDIVHCHLNCLSAIPLMYAKKYSIKVRIAHSHIILSGFSLKNTYKKFARLFIPLFANYFCACGEDAGKWMFLNRKFTVIKNAIDINKFIDSQNMRKEYRSRYKIENKIVLGNVGRNTLQKNQTFLLYLLKELIAKNDKYMLVIVGSGVERENLILLSKELQVENNVIFIEPQYDIYNIYAMFDWFLFPSIYEGLGIVAIESQASGIRTLCSTNVPQEVKITKLVKFMNLQLNEWKNTILKDEHISDVDIINEITAAGYNIRVESKKLYELYINLLKK